ncbi:hypothetical protein Dsin_023118 [Dipteronia sinensis]|uniref:BED-type domain-containing protein n=1 Tax=Dipteronia sinensis TaxID=43782 RepID=A0AAE0E0G0_9ROSI|nr:hypothetical protein Dsin_023118 [Dipteronia sinensis]
MSRPSGTFTPLDKQKKPRSDVWDKFEKYKDEDGKDLAKCNLCEKLFDGSSKKGTTHLRNHFNSCQKKRNEGGASDSGDKPAGNSVTDQQSNHLDRVKTLIKQCRWPSPNQVGDADIISVYNEEKEKLRMYFEKLCCRFSLMIKYVVYGNYTCFKVCFIDDDWKLKEKIIGVKCIEGDQNMEVLKTVLLDLGIDNKIFSMVTDSHSEIYVDKYVMSSDERENRFSGQVSLLSNCKFCVPDFSNMYISCGGFEDRMGEVLHDHMSKIFNYITQTSSKIVTFRMAIGKARSLGKEVTAEDIPTEEKLENMYWFDLLTIALGLKEAFFELENIDLDFKPINLTKEEWDVITTFYLFCDEENDIDGMLCFGPECETANMYFPALCRMYKKSLVLVTLDSFICGERYRQLVRDVEICRNQFKNCWNQYNLILAVAAVLDPRFKMDIVKHWYKKIYGDECETQFEIFMNYFTDVYNEYAKGTNNFQSSISYGMLDFSGNISYHEGLELDLYLKYFNFPSWENFDILGWWRAYSRNLPTLAKMARDFLSIKIAVR